MAGESRFRLSHALWGLDWSRVLPYELSDDGIEVESTSYDPAAAFVHEHYAALFDEDPSSPFRTRLGDGAKKRYYQLAADLFRFAHQGRTVGLLVCEPLDWSSYYLRSTAVLREYQGRQLVPRFCSRVLFPELERAGVERVECDTSPANLAMMHIMGRLRFNVTGTNLSERWGANVHFTKFLGAECEAIFLRQFCSGVMYQRRASQKGGGDEEEIRANQLLERSLLVSE